MLTFWKTYCWSLLAALLFGGGVGLVIAHFFLPYQYTVIQPMVFTEDEASRDEGADWELFVLHQRYAIERLALKDVPGYWEKVAVSSPVKGEITISLTAVDELAVLRGVMQHVLDGYLYDAETEAVAREEAAAEEHFSAVDGSVVIIADPCDGEVELGGADEAAFAVVRPTGDMQWSRRLSFVQIAAVGWSAGMMLLIAAVCCYFVGRTQRRERDYDTAILDELLKDAANQQEAKKAEPISGEEGLADKDDADGAAGGAGSDGGTWSKHYEAAADKIESLLNQAGPIKVVVVPATVGAQSPRPAVNIAICLARRQRRVLLVNSTWHNHDLADVFDVAKGPGFYDYPDGAEGKVGAWCQASQIPFLAVLSAGVDEHKEFSGELAQRAERCVAELAAGSDYDIVIFYHMHPLNEPPSSAVGRYTRKLIELAHGGVVVTSYRSRLVTQRLERKLRKQWQKEQATLLDVITMQG